MEQRTTAFQFANSFSYRCNESNFTRSTTLHRSVGRYTRPEIRRTIVATAVPRERKVASDARIKTEVIASPLRAGIKAIAIGKHGTRPIPQEIRHPIISELNMLSSLDPSDIKDEDLHHDLFLLRASFMGALFVKATLDQGEMQILSLASTEHTQTFAGGRIRDGHGLSCSAGEVLAYVTCGESAKSMRKLYDFALRLMDGESLNMEETETLGKLLFTDAPESITTQAAKVLVVHVMRIRHESATEIAGLARAAAATLSPEFRASTTTTAAAAPFVLLAEPFDGTITWDILTPLIARHLRNTYGFHTVMSTGASSGPKMGPNLRALATQLGMSFARNADELQEAAEFGAVVDQKHISGGLAQWIHSRRVILKRPFIATVEKFIDPVPGGAQVFVASAFHGAYIDKMGAAAEAMQFPAYVIVGQGMEGTMGVGVGSNRKVTFLVGLQNPDCTYVREHIKLKVMDVGVQPCDETVVKGSATVSGTATRIQRYAQSGSSGNSLFDTRVKATLSCFDVVFSKIVTHLHENK